MMLTSDWGPILTRAITSKGTVGLHKKFLLVLSHLQQVFIHVVSEVFQQRDFLVEHLWEHFECVVVLLAVPLNVVNIPGKQNDGYTLVEV